MTRCEYKYINKYMNRYTRNSIESRVDFDTAMRLRDEGVETPTDMYYKLITPTGEHLPEFSREVIMSAYGSEDALIDDFVPAPTRKEIEDYLDYSGLFISDELLNNINNM